MSDLLREAPAETVGPRRLYLGYDERFALRRLVSEARRARLESGREVLTERRATARRAVVDGLEAADGPMSMAELVERTGLRLEVLRDALRALVAAWQVEESGHRGRGRERLWRLRG